MSYNLISYYELSKRQLDIFYKFLKQTASETTQPARHNMYDRDWKKKSNTLPYLLEKTDRFKVNGAFNILFDDKVIVGCSGVYRSNFCSEFAIGGTRTWIDKNYRNKQISRDFFLPKEKEWAITSNHKAMGLTFNEYNKNMIYIWDRIRLGENRQERQPHHFGFNGVNIVEFPIIIQYTKQYLIYEKFDNDWNYDWDSLK